MPEPLLSTRLKARGPWLLDGDQLRHLEGEVEQFIQERPMQAAAAADGTTISTQREVFSRSLTILLSHDRELPIESFKQAFLQAGYQNEIATGFNYKLKLGDTQAFVRLSTDSKKGQESQVVDKELEIKVSPQTSRLSQELFAVLKGWAEDVEPPIWQRWLLAIRPAATFLLVVILIVGSADFFFPTTNYKQLYKEEAHKILRDGVNQSNQQRAIELLLALQTDYNPPVQKHQRFGTVNPTLAVVAIILAVVAITPRICLGFWKGKRRLRLCRWWMKAVPGAIPGLIAARYVLPQLFTFAERAFGH